MTIKVILQSWPEFLEAWLTLISVNYPGVSIEADNW